MIDKKLGLPMAKTKIGLPENRKRLQSAGVEKARNASFDEGYDAGFKAGIEYSKVNK